MLALAYTIHVLICLFLILVVLLQQGKGADLSVFGGGTTQAAFGARGAATLLHKLTVFSFVGFILTTLGIGFLSKGGGGASVMSEVAAEANDTELGEPIPEGEPPPEGDELLLDVAPAEDEAAAESAVGTLEGGAAAPPAVVAEPESGGEPEPPGG